MQESNIDRIIRLTTGEDKEILLSALSGHQDSHAHMGRVLGVSEKAVRNWRSKNDRERTVPKILLWDIESSPILGWTWGLWEQNVLHVEQDWKLLTVSWTWYGSKEYHVKQLCDFKGYRKGDMDDSKLALFIRNLLNEADYAGAHNGDAFDVKKVKAKFVEYGIDPPSPYNQIDTLKVARQNFKMSSNRLDSLGVTLGVGRKVKHSGFDLWLRCMAGDKQAWKAMEEYARQDVVLLEAVFDKLLPYVKGLNYNLFTDKFVCNNCGSSDLKEGGLFKTQVAKKPAWQCQSCGHWTKGK